MVTAGVLVVGSIIAWFAGLNVASLTLFAIVGGLASFLSWVVGVISTVFTYILFQILPYNNFINEDIVKMGWVTVRDLCNMFFILILLIIAFATILRIETYSWKKNLPKLLIMAVLINFSKTICGLAIDFSQVIMLTFANAFSGAGAYSLYTIFGLQNLFSIKTLTDAASTKTNMDTNSGFAVAGSLVLGLILVIVATVVIVIYTIILIYRIIMLWILIILSPLAFLAMAIPAGAKYASQWTGEFVKYLIIGPVMAFFLWLALSMATATEMPIKLAYTSGGGAVSISEVTAPSGTGSTASEPGNMKQFLVTTIFLMASLMMAQQMGGAAGGLAGGAINKLKQTGGAIGKFGMFKAGRMADEAQYKAQGAIAKGVSRLTGGYFGEKYQAKSLNYRMIKSGWDKNQESKMRKYEGTKAGAWQDQFNRTISASIGIPIVSQIKRKNAEIKIKENETEMAKIQNIINQDKEKLKVEGIPEENKVEILANIKVNEAEIAKFKKENRGLANVTATWGKLPIQKYARLEEQQRANEKYNDIKKEDLNEEGLVHNYLTEGTVDKKRGYLMHLADTNGINSLFDARGEDMTAENIQKLFSEFGEAAGDVAAEVSRRAEAAGNYKLMGFHKFDVTQGRNRVATKDEQFEYAMRKDNERYAQNHGRTTHFDSLVDRHADGTNTLSDIGTEQLLHIASSKGRIKELKNGNYQTRYGETVVNLKTDIENKIQQFRETGEEGKANGLKLVLSEFEQHYGTLGKKVEKAAESASSTDETSSSD